ncbi:unnamed protein product, partial [Aphanomyces euteiches]
TIEAISRRYVNLRGDIQRGLAAPPQRERRPQLPRPVDLPDSFESDIEGSMDGTSETDESHDSGDNGDHFPETV